MFVFFIDFYKACILIKTRSSGVEAAERPHRVCLAPAGTVDLPGVGWFFTLKSQRTRGRREIQRDDRKQLLLFFLFGQILLNLGA